MSAPTGLILPINGADLTPLPLVSLLGSGSLAWPSANRAIFVKFRLRQARLVTGIKIANAAPSGNAKAGLYRSDGTTLTEIAAVGSTPLSGSNDDQDLVFSSAITAFPAQDFFAMLVLDNSTATLIRQTIPNAAFASGFQVAYYVDSAFTTPPTSQAISGLTGSTYVPVMSLI